MFSFEIKIKKEKTLNPIYLLPVSDFLKCLCYESKRLFEDAVG